MMMSLIILFMGVCKEVSVPAGVVYCGGHGRKHIATGAMYCNTLTSYSVVLYVVCLCGRTGEEAVPGRLRRG